MQNIKKIFYSEDVQNKNRSFCDVNFAYIDQSKRRIHMFCSWHSIDT